MFKQINVDKQIRETVEDGEGAVLLHLDRGRYFSLNGLGAEVWSCLAQKQSAEQILAGLASKYSQPRERIEADVQRFLGSLEEKGLIHVVR